ncbi:MAG: hypothetical protein WC081_05670 [Candidatus Ratteibacteria bacterium]|jgi:hypothetical protein
MRLQKGGEMKVSSKSAVILIVALCLMAGCATTTIGTKHANVSREMAEKEIKRGVTTKQEVLQIFGPPNTIATGLNHSKMTGVSVPEETKSKITEMWGYIKSEAKAVLFSGSVKAVGINIFFDQEGKVLDYTVTTTQF